MKVLAKLEDSVNSSQLNQNRRSVLNDEQIDVQMIDDASLRQVNKNWANVASNYGKKSKDPSQRMSTEQIEVVNTVLYEDKEREKRKTNILIFGLEQGAEEESVSELIKKVNNIFELIEVDKNVITRARRFRPSSQNTIAPVFVQIDSERNRNWVLKQAKNLKRIQGMRNLYLKADQTEAERMLEKQLRKRKDELNQEEMNNDSTYRWYVRNGELRKGKDNSSNITSEDLRKKKTEEWARVRGNVNQRARTKPNERQNTKPEERAKDKPLENAMSDQFINEQRGRPNNQQTQ